MNQMWQMWESGLNPNFIKQANEYCQSLVPVESALGYDGTTVNNSYRKSELRWVDKWTDNGKWIHDTIYSYAALANRAAFGFDISMLNDIQYTTYYGNVGGKYDWHHDTFFANPSAFDRKISVIIQMSDPSEYEGGAVEFDPQYETPNPVALSKLGTVFVFPSFVKHRVAPVTSGVRRSLIGWIEGPKFR